MLREDIFECADLAAHLPLDDTSAVYRAINPDWRWTLDNHLSAIQSDALRMLLWAKTKDAQRRVPINQPKPIPRPGIDENETKDNRFKDTEGLPREDFLAWMDRAGIKRAV